MTSESFLDSFTHVLNILFFKASCFFGISMHFVRSLVRPSSFLIDPKSMAKVTTEQ